MTERARPARLEGVADCTDRAALGDMKERTGYSGEEVGVFVCVEVSDIDSGALQLLYLGKGFAFDVILANVASQQRLYEVHEAGSESLAVGAQKRWYAVRVRDGDAIG